MRAHRYFVSDSLLRAVERAGGLVLRPGVFKHRVGELVELEAPDGTVTVGDIVSVDLRPRQTITVRIRRTEAR